MKKFCTYVVEEAPSFVFRLSDSLNEVQRISLDVLTHVNKENYTHYGTFDYWPPDYTMLYLKLQK